jgi:hypothetical protein
METPTSRGLDREHELRPFRGTPCLGVSFGTSSSSCSYPRDEPDSSFPSEYMGNVSHSIPSRGTYMFWAWFDGGGGHGVGGTAGGHVIAKPHLVFIAIVPFHAFHVSVKLGNPR